MTKYVSPDSPVFSVIVVARNEHAHLPDLLGDLARQDFPKEQTEIILVDGASEDGTRVVMNDFARLNYDRNVKIIDNPDRILASGWNSAIRAATGKFVIRPDAHARLPKDFLTRNLEQLRGTEKIVGGQISNVRPSGFLKEIVFCAASCRFGASAATFRGRAAPGHVDTLAFAAYSRDIFDEVGLFNENLVRNQDNEMHCRIRRAGYKFYYHPSIVSYYVPRASFGGLLKQMFRNGRWMVPTLMAQPGSFSFRHYAPVVFVLSTAITAAVAAAYSVLPLAVLMSVYFFTGLAFAVNSHKCLRGLQKTFGPIMPLLFFMIHWAYGLGALCGAIQARRQQPGTGRSKPEPAAPRVRQQSM